MLKIPMLNLLLPRTLLGRALLIVVTPLVLIQMVSAYVFYESHWDQISKRLSQGLAGDVAVLVEALAEMPNAASRDWLFKAAAEQMEIVATMEPGSILPNAPRRETGIEGELRRALLRKEIANPVRVDEQTTKDKVVVLVQLPQGVLRLEAPRSRLFSWTTYAFVLWTVGTTLILLGIATLVMRNQVRPVRRLAQVAEAFGKGAPLEGSTPSLERSPPSSALSSAAPRPLASDPMLRQAIELLFFAYRDFTGDADELLARYGFGRAHHRVIYFVGRQPGMTVGELLGLLKITKQSLARVLGQLMRQGFIVQRTQPGDRRRRHLHLTPAALALEATLTERQAQRLATAWDTAGAGAAEGFRSVLKAMINPQDQRRFGGPS